MSHKDDARMLRAIVREAESFDDERAEAFESTLAAFVDMLSRLERGGRELTTKQRDWVKGVYEDVCGDVQYLNEWSAGKIPEGRPVPTPEVLKHLPLKPPTRRSEDSHE